MDPNRDLAARTNALLARVESMQHALETLRLELRDHLQALETRNESVNQDGPTPMFAPVQAEPTSSAETIVDSSPADAKLTTEAERRVTPRKQASMVLVTLSNYDPTAPPIPGWVIDYSPVGLGILIEEDIPLETVIKIRPFQASDRCTWREARIRNSRRGDEGWKIGCQLRHELTRDELRQLGLE